MWVITLAPTCATFLARIDPPSSRKNPACMKKISANEIVQKTTATAEARCASWSWVTGRGLVHPRTYWVVWTEWPQDLDTELDNLDRVRRALAADRALAIVWANFVPDQYRVDRQRDTTAAMTVRRLALELSGLIDDTR